MQAIKKNISKVVIYCLGILLFAIGVAFAIKSNLGVSPVSTLPYVASLITGGSVGMMTALLYVFFVMVQWVILRGEFKAKDGLQLIFAFAFGSCVDVSRYMIRNLTYTTLFLQVIYQLLGIVLIAFGIFLILESGLIVSPTDGLVKAIAHRFKLEFSKVKIAIDLGASMGSALISYLYFGEIHGVGVGTILAAFGVGLCIRFFERIWKRLR